MILSNLYVIIKLIKKQSKSGSINKSQNYEKILNISEPSWFSCVVIHWDIYVSNWTIFSKDPPQVFRSKKRISILLCVQYCRHLNFFFLSFTYFIFLFLFLFVIFLFCFCFVTFCKISNSNFIRINLVVLMF